MRRLREERRQPELADAKMLIWAEFLKREAEADALEVLDTSRISIEESVDYVCKRLKS
jgi:hypothetical protein